MAPSSEAQRCWMPNFPTRSWGKPSLRTRTSSALCWRRADFTRGQHFRSDFGCELDVGSACSDARNPQYQLSQNQSRRFARFQGALIESCQVPSSHIARRLLQSRAHRTLRFLRKRLQRCTIRPRAAGKQPVSWLSTRTDANFSNCRLKACDFAKADLARARFQRADLTGSQLDRARLQGSRLSRGAIGWRDPVPRRSHGSALCGPRCFQRRICEARI